MHRFIIVLLVFICIQTAPTFGQFDSPTNTAQDTIGQDEFGLFNENNKNTFKVMFSGNPGRAALYSLILPGAGQFYNKRYWKIPLVYAGLGAVGYLLYDNNRTYQLYKQKYLDNIDGSERDLWFSYYISSKQSREQAIFAVIGVHLFNVFDAYIDRHLIDFDMSEDLSIDIKAYPDGISPLGLSVAYTFK